MQLDALDLDDSPLIHSAHACYQYNESMLFKTSLAHPLAVPVARFVT